MHYFYMCLFQNCTLHISNVYTIYHQELLITVYAAVCTYLAENTKIVVLKNVLSHVCCTIMLHCTHTVFLLCSYIYMLLLPVGH